MIGSRKFITLIVAAATLSTSVPALARPWGPGWGPPPPRHYYRGGSGTGNVLLGALIGGGVVAAVASANRPRYVEPDYRAAPPPYAAPDTQGAAVDTCSAAVEARDGRGSRVREIDRVVREDDGWRVEGVIDAGLRYDGYRDIDRFSCNVGYGEVRDLRFADGGTWR